MNKEVSKSFRILIVDDEAGNRESLSQVLSLEGWSVESCASAQEALKLLRDSSDSSFDLVVSDIRMEGMDGIELLKSIQALKVDTDVIMVTAYGSVEKAVESMKLGAVDFLLKPLKRATVVKTVQNALEKKLLRRENKILKKKLQDIKGHYQPFEMIGESKQVRSLRSMIGKIAPTDASVLILGESGTGKELVARALHRQSNRFEKPFIAINCASIPSHLLESELFGYVKGAFTGADQDKKGKLELASGGTLFLDEIGDMPFELQVKLLRVLQEGSYDPLGAQSPKKVDLRVISATNRDLEKEVKQGGFRKDLYFRLNVLSLECAPLRERPEDISLLAHFFLQKHAPQGSREILGFTDEALNALRVYEWPGNIRELENTVQRALVFSEKDRIEVEDLPLAVTREGKTQVARKPDESPILSGKRGESELVVPLGTPLKEIESQLIQETLRMTKGDKNLTAKLLGMAPRTLYRRLEGGET